LIRAKPVNSLPIIHMIWKLVWKKELICPSEPFILFPQSSLKLYANSLMRILQPDSSNSLPLHTELLSCLSRRRTAPYVFVWISKASIRSPRKTNTLYLAYPTS
jgi:hypothetical protein